MANLAQDTASALRHAQTLASQGRHGEAERVLKAIVAHNPACGPALYRLGVMAAQRDETDEAAEYFIKALAQAPEAPEILLSLATIRIEQGRTEDARVLAGRAGNLTNSALTLYRLGLLQRQAGELDEAANAFEKALRFQPDYIPAYYGLRSVRKFHQGEGHFTRLQELAGRGGASVADRILALFTLGRGYLDHGDDARAFAAFEEGNRLKKSTLPAFEADKFDAYIDSAIRLFDDKLVSKLAGKSRHDSEKPVFVVGMPRSGSTLVDQIVSSHMQAGSVGEAKFLRRCIPAYPNVEVQGLFTKGHPSITQAFIDALGPELLDNIAAKYLTLSEQAVRGASRIVDKMLFNYLWAGLIRLALPKSHIVHCTRDPRDIALSLWQLTFPSGMQWAYDQQDIARYYLAYQKLMRHWQQLFPQDIHEVRYETMVAGQEKETRRLLAFCNLPWDDRCLNFHEAERLVKTSSAAQVRKPVYSGSSGKWRQYENYLQPLIAALDKAS